MLELADLSITLSQTGRPIVEQFSFTLDRGDKAVVIGEEGNGKSTLLKCIYDRAMTEGYCEVSGRVLLRGRAGYLPQMLDPALVKRTVAQLFAGADIHGHLDLLTRLGLPVAFLGSGQTLGSLSGGEKVKLQLARLLLDDPDILLLDEPTNDLDVETLRWLEDFIRTTRLPLLYVSHDETLIENTANVILHMEQLIRKTRCRMTVTRCGYREYLSRRRAGLDKQGQVAKKQREEHDKQMARWRQIHDRVEHEQNAVSRGDPGSGRLLKKKMKAVQAQGRRYERETAAFTDFPEEEDAILVRFRPDLRVPAGKVILDYTLPLLSVGERALARDIRLYAAGGTHVGITGRNGAGKSTLLALLWAELRERRDITACYMPQDYSQALDYTQTPVEHLAAHYTKDEVTRARTYLGSMRFTHEEMTGPIGRLSGGQRAKLLFLDMVLQDANVLLLDEPTRNFSPLSGPVIRRTLADFGGAILSVSHDRKYLEEVCDAVYELTESGLCLLTEFS